MDRTHIEGRPNYSNGPEAWDRAGVHFSKVAYLSVEDAARELKRGSEFAVMPEWGDDLEWEDNIPSFDGSNRLKRLRAWLEERADDTHLLCFMHSDDGTRTLLVRQPDC